LSDLYLLDRAEAIKLHRRLTSPPLALRPGFKPYKTESQPGNGLPGCESRDQPGNGFPGCEADGPCAAEPTTRQSTALQPGNGRASNPAIHSTQPGNPLPTNKK